MSEFHGLSAGNTRCPFNEPPDAAGFLGLLGLDGFDVLSIASVAVVLVHADAAAIIKQSAVVRMPNDGAASVRRAVTGITPHHDHYATILITVDEPAAACGEHRLSRTAADGAGHAVSESDAGRRDCSHRDGRVRVTQSVVMRLLARRTHHRH